MEVITEFPPIFYSILFGLAIISLGIIGVIIFKKFQDDKHRQKIKNNNLKTDVKKIEWALNKILSILDDLEKKIETYSYDVDLNESHPKDIWKIELEIQSIRGIIQHQLGHLPRMRGWLQ